MVKNRENEKNLNSLPFQFNSKEHANNQIELYKNNGSGMIADLMEEYGITDANVIIKQQFEVWDTLNTSAKDEIEQKSKDDDGILDAEDDFEHALI